MLEWLAEQADLSLQVDEYPDGTFNYSDRHEYSPTEAIDLINGVLVTRGYTVVRRGRILMVLNLDEASPIPDILVEFVPMENLDARGEFELIKTIFELAKVDPVELDGEIRPLLGPGRTMVVLPKSRAATMAVDNTAATADPDAEQTNQEQRLAVKCCKGGEAFFGQRRLEDSWWWGIGDSRKRKGRMV